MPPSFASSATTPNISASPSSDGALAGFLVGFGQDAPHDSSNFPGSASATRDFLYIDRIVVASRRRGGGVGRVFYADVQSYAEVR